jgi:hypothetical protein
MLPAGSCRPRASTVPDRRARRAGRTRSVVIQASRPSATVSGDEGIQEVGVRGSLRERRAWRRTRHRHRSGCSGNRQGRGLPTSKGTRVPVATTTSTRPWNNALRSCRPTGTCSERDLFGSASAHHGLPAASPVGQVVHEYTGPWRLGRPNPCAV